MTISESITRWLKKCPVFDNLEFIDTEILENRMLANALSKEPINVVVPYLNGAEERTEYYTFMTRRSTQANSERIDNDKLLEELELWVDTKDYEEDYPILDNNRYCHGIGISTTFSISETEEEESIYILTIQIEYRKER